MSSGAAAFRVHSFKPFTKQQQNSISEAKIPRQSIYPKTNTLEKIQHIKDLKETKLETS